MKRVVQANKLKEYMEQALVKRVHDLKDEALGGIISPNIDPIEFAEQEELKLSKLINSTETASGNGTVFSASTTKKA